MAVGRTRLMFGAYGKPRCRQRASRSRPRRVASARAGVTVPADLLELPGTSSLGRRPGAERQRPPSASSFFSLSAYSRSHSAPAPPGPSRSITSYVSTSFEEEDKRRSQRRERGKLREALNRVSRLRRFRECGWPGRGDQAEIAARNGKAHWRGVQRCGSIHACAVDAATIRNYRSVEVSTAAATWIDAGNEVYMVTLTAPHELGMPLTDLLDLISNGFRSLLSGRIWAGTSARYVPERPSKRGGMLPARYYPAKPGMREKLGIEGTVRSLEVTHGPNGWHPHLHVLVFVRGRFDAARRAGFEVYFRDRWRKYIVSQGYRPPSDQHGVKVERCYSAEGAADYVTKTQEGHSVGIEMARADIKHARGEHRVPFQILASAAEGNAADLRLWHEYEAATKGRKCITWSNGLRDAVWAAAPEPVLADDWLAELTDEEIVALEPTYSDEAGDHVEPGRVPDSDTVARVSTLAMRHARLISGFRTTALEAFEDGGVDYLAEVVRSLGFDVKWDRDGLVPVVVPVLTGSVGCRDG